MKRLSADEIAAKSARARAAWGVKPGEVQAVFGTMTSPPSVAKKAKYGNTKTADGDSKKEAKRLRVLKFLAKQGVIKNLAWQVRYTLIQKQQLADGTHERAVTYTCDAQYVENGMLVVEDTKSEVTRKLPAYIHKRKLMFLLYGIAIKEV